MEFTAHQPAASLGPYIEAIFHYQNFVPDHSIERVVPTGHIFILFELDGFVRNTFDNQTLEPNAEYSQVWISGMHRGHISISAHENSEMFVIQFKPYGSRPFLHLHTAELNEKVIAIEEVLGTSLLDLREAMLKTDTPQDKFELAEAWLLERFDASRQPPQELIDFVDVLQKEPVAKLHELIADHGNSQKHLIEQFKKYLGLTPKWYQRIVRFNELLLKIQQQQEISWAEIAYDCGYADQPHFIREFKHFSGMNPAEYIQQEFNQGEPNFFPLDRDG
ncbi:MAG: helix-turn-helix domain-containing protein [Pseudomonadota bacterium]